MLNDIKTPPTPSQMPREIQSGEIPVYITKSNHFRVIHVDGFFGGGAPTPGSIIMTVYNQRFPFAGKVFLDAMGQEILSKREVNAGIEHEYEASLVMNLSTAKVMLNWLKDTINNTENALLQLQTRK